MEKQRRRQSRQRARRRNITAPLWFGLGFFLVWGTIGAHELGGMSQGRFWIQCFIGFVLMGSLTYEGK